MDFRMGRFVHGAREANQVGDEWWTMIITKVGNVILGDGPIRVENWLVQREPSDPPQATTEELLLALAAEWALDKLQKAVQSESIKALLKESRRIKAEAVLAEIKGN